MGKAFERLAKRGDDAWGLGQAEKREGKPVVRQSACIWQAGRRKGGLVSARPRRRGATRRPLCLTTPAWTQKKSFCIVAELERLDLQEKSSARGQRSLASGTSRRRRTLLRRTGAAASIGRIRWRHCEAAREKLRWPRRQKKPVSRATDRVVKARGCEAKRKGRSPCV